ncbi:MAG: hypothetical protein IT384_29350 [Deltaproteobacteria bacterium]|nr:hypothetical protein [Deltaproteobacteria bacterium]
MNSPGQPGSPEWEGGGEGSHDKAKRPAAWQAPPKEQFENPLSHAIHDWLLSAVKAAKALRVYDRNNAMITQFMDRAHTQLEAIHAELPELTLTVREDRLFFGRDAVHVNNDRQEGIPFILYRNAFRRITFVHGMGKEELLEFLASLSIDFGNYAYSGEDLVSVLWRLQLPHLRYFTIDALSMTVEGGTEVGRKQVQEVERLQGEIDGLVAKLYSTKEVSDEDLVKGVSITREDLEALKAIRAEGEEDLELLDVATARVIAAVGEEELGSFRELLLHEDHDVLVTRVIDTLLEILYREESSRESSKTVELIQQLFDSLLLAQRFGHARHLVFLLRERERAGRDLKEVHLSRQLLRLLSSEARVSQVLSSLADAKQTTSASDVAEFFRTLGPVVTNSLLAALDSLSSHAHRRMVCDLIVELGAPDGTILFEKMQRSNWTVVVDLLSIGARLSPEDLAPIVLWAAEHEHPKVRAQALSLMRTFSGGVADELIAKALHDPEHEVREAALRLVRQRRSQVFSETLEQLVRADELFDRDEREIRNLVMAYATLAGDASVPVLDRLLSPGIFARSKMYGAQIAAAMALGKVGTETARQTLMKGSRTLNAKVREACKRALTHHAEPDAGLEPEVVPTFVGEVSRAEDDGPGIADDVLARARARKPARSVLIPATTTPGKAAADAGGRHPGVHVVRGDAERMPDRLPPPSVPPPPRSSAPPPGRSSGPPPPAATPPRGHPPGSTTPPRGNAPSSQPAAPPQSLVPPASTPPHGFAPSPSASPPGYAAGGTAPFPPSAFTPPGHLPPSALTQPGFAPPQSPLAPRAFPPPNAATQPAFGAQGPSIGQPPFPRSPVPSQPSFGPSFPAPPSSAVGQPGFSPPPSFATGPHSSPTGYPGFPPRAPSAPAYPAAAGSGFPPPPPLGPLPGLPSGYPAAPRPRLAHTATPSGGFRSPIAQPAGLPTPPAAERRTDVASDLTLEPQTAQTAPAWGWPPPPDPSAPAWAWQEGAPRPAAAPQQPNPWGGPAAPAAPPPFPAPPPGESGPWGSPTGGWNNPSWITQVGQEPSWAEGIPPASTQMPWTASPVPHPQLEPPPPGGGPAFPVPGARPRAAYPVAAAPARSAPPAPDPASTFGSEAETDDWEPLNEPGLESFVVRRSSQPPPPAAVPSSRPAPPASNRPAPAAPSRPAPPAASSASRGASQETQRTGGVYKVHGQREEMPMLPRAPVAPPMTPRPPPPGPPPVPEDDSHPLFGDDPED